MSAAATVDVAEDMWGPDLACLKGKTSRETPKPARSDTTDMPKESHQKHHETQLHPAHCCKCKDVPNGSDDACCKTLDKSIRLHGKAEFKIKTIGCDRECRSMMDRVSMWQDNRNSTVGTSEEPIGRFGNGTGNNSGQVCKQSRNGHAQH